MLQEKDCLFKEQEQESLQTLEDAREKNSQCHDDGGKPYSSSHIYVVHGGVFR